MTDEEDEPTALDVPHYGSCPACGYVLDDSLDDARVCVPDDEETLHVVRFDCPECGRPLRLVGEKPEEGLGVKLSLEVDRDSLDEDAEP